MIDLPARLTGRTDGGSIRRRSRPPLQTDRTSAADRSISTAHYERRRRRRRGMLTQNADNASNKINFTTIITEGKNAKNRQIGVRCDDVSTAPVVGAKFANYSQKSGEIRRIRSKVLHATQPQRYSCWSMAAISSLRLNVPHCTRHICFPYARRGSLNIHDRRSPVSPLGPAR